MAKIEKEFKILDIKVDKIKIKLEIIGAKFKGKINQKIYVYDLPTIYYRFLEIKELLKSDNTMIINTNLQKLKTLIIEYQDLVSETELKKVEKKFCLNNIIDILALDISRIREILDDRDFNKSINNLKINPNKWIRLRKSNEKIELTCKHILEKKSTNFQNVFEVEFEVSQLEEVNMFLNNIGISRRSYQEKIRYSYVYKDAKIEIDEWPLLNPYLEIECDNDDTINELISKLNLNKYEIVSLNTEQLYKRIGVDVHSISELKFEGQDN